MALKILHLTLTHVVCPCAHRGRSGQQQRGRGPKHGPAAPVSWPQPAGARLRTAAAAEQGPQQVRLAKGCG